MASQEVKKQQGSSDHGAQDLKWLIKSDDKITGPFSLEEVKTKLLAREITIFDEVMKPLGRWRHLRAEEDFSEAVEAMRTDLMNSREDTEVQTTITQTELVLKPETDVDGVRDVSGPSFNSGTSRRYGVGTQAKTMVFKEAKALWYLFGGLVLATIVIYFVLNGRGFGEGRRNYQDLITRAQEAIYNGDSFLALKLLNQADEVRMSGGLSLDPNAALQLAALKMRYNGEIVAAKRLANEVLKLDVSGLLKSQARNVLAMAAVRNEEIKRARSLIEEAGLASPEVAFNRAVVDVMGSDFESAVTVLRNLLKAKPDFDEARYLLGRALFKYDALGQTGQAEAQEIFKTMRSERGIYTFDASIALALMELQRGDRSSAAASIKSAMDEDPLLLEDQVTSVFLLRQLVGPSALIEDCKKIHKGLGNYISQSLLAICYARAGEPSLALETLSTVLAGKPQDPLIQSVSAMVLFASARDEDARTTLKLYRTKPDFPVLGQLLTLRDCVAKADADCEGKMIELLRPLTPAHPVALAAEIRILQKTGKANEARQLYKQLKDRTPMLKQVHQLSRIVDTKG